jgi:hypothetical protein
MGRFRNYGNARGARTYLSRRDEYSLSDDEKHEAYKRRSSAIQAPVKPMPVPKLVPVQPFWAPTVDYDAMLAASERAPEYKPTAAPPPPRLPWDRPEHRCKRPNGSRRRRSTSSPALTTKTRKKAPAKPQACEPTLRAGPLRLFSRPHPGAARQLGQGHLLQYTRLLRQVGAKRLKHQLQTTPHDFLTICALQLVGAQHHGAQALYFP